LFRVDTDEVSLADDVFGLLALSDAIM